ncbi:MAG: dihydropyrimidinase [Rhodospirillaceae bacterium]
MTEFDLAIRGGTVVTASSKMNCDIGIKDGVIAALAGNLGPAKRDIDADGKLVLPGGIEGHCHIEQKSAFGLMSADDFESGSIAAAFGGNTTIIPFAAQHKGDSLRATVENYHACAGPKAVIDYAYHLIVSDPTPEVLGQELPALIKGGFTSFKVYMTYDLLRLDDKQILDVLSVARQEGALVMIHAENYEMIRWLTERLLAANHREPKYHAVSHCRISESEATHRAIALSRLVDTPILIVHVSTEEATAEIRKAQDAGLKVYGETCPQYLFLTADDIDKQGMEGAKFCCSPPPRDAEAQEAIWRGIRNGTFQVFSSDHAPYRLDETGKLYAGPNPPFNKIANGVPGIELRLPLLFSEGVGKGRIDIHKFIELTSTNVARIYGLFPRKGTIQIGADADLAIWDPDLEKTVTWDHLHDRTGYTPYEGKTLKGWPVVTINRGRVVVADGELQVQAGSGNFLERDFSGFATPLGQLEPELDPARNFGASILPGAPAR